MITKEDVSKRKYSELTLKNSTGDIVVKLYIADDGNLHPDSWIKDFKYENLKIKNELPYEKKERGK